MSRLGESLMSSLLGLNAMPSVAIRFPASTAADGLAGQRRDPVRRPRLMASTVAAG